MTLRDYARKARERGSREAFAHYAFDEEEGGGNIVVDGVLLKKRRSRCFSELMPRRYLLGLTMDSSGRAGWLSMGCRSIFAVDGDRLSPRETNPDDSFIKDVSERLNNSLTAFFKAVQGSSKR